MILLTVIDVNLGGLSSPQAVTARALTWTGGFAKLTAVPRLTF